MKTLDEMFAEDVALTPEQKIRFSTVWLRSQKLPKTPDGHLAFLDLQEGASPEQIKIVFGRMIREFHPDRYPANIGSFRKVLSDVAERLIIAKETLLG